MTKYLFLIFWMVATSFVSFAQNDVQKKVERFKKYTPKFQRAKNDSVFIVRHKESFHLMHLEGKEMNAATKDILYSSHPGDVIGPFQDENYMCLFKVLSKDTIYKMRVSHIYISWKAHNNDTSTVMSLAESFLQRVKSGEDYNELARLEGEVSSGDLGWFNSGVMVKPFEDAIMKAQKGDLFIVQTIFGAHVVLVTENKEFEDYKFTVVPFIKKL